VQELVVEVRKLQDTQVHMANRIERIVYILQNALRDMYVRASERVSDCAMIVLYRDLLTQSIPRRNAQGHQFSSHGACGNGRCRAETSQGHPGWQPSCRVSDSFARRQRRRQRRGNALQLQEIDRIGGVVTRYC